MQNDDQTSPSGDGRIVPFKPRAGRPPEPAPPSVEDLSRYQIDSTPDDYRHRMMVNLAAVVVIAALIGIGYWLADTMARMQKNQDCVLSGRRGCTPVDVDTNRY